MQRLRFSFLLCCLLISYSTIFSTNEMIPVHEFHISKTLIEYNEKENALQFTLHIFIDDLEEALRQQGADKLFICTEKEAEKADDYIYKYLQQKLKIKVDDKAVEYTFVGKEVSEDLVAVWCYLEIENIDSFSKLYIKNNTLVETFDDQKNIISVSGPNKQKGYLLFNQAKSEETLEF